MAKAKTQRNYPSVWIKSDTARPMAREAEGLHNHITNIPRQVQVHKILLVPGSYKPSDRCRAPVTHL
jgi:hypothetical protein